MLKRKILIVDDEENARLYLANIMEELHPDYLIRFAASPAEALYILQIDKLDLVLLDVEMPGMTGLDLLSELRKMSENIPAIFVSAYKRAEFIQRALRLDAVDYIDKPVDPQELENAISKVFNQVMKTKDSNSDFLFGQRFCMLTTSGEIFVEFDEILYFESLKRYSVAYFVDGTSKIVRDNLIGLSTKLPEQKFIRISRQYIVNMRYIKQVSRNNKTLRLNSIKKNIELNRIYPHIIQQIINDFKL